MRRNTGTTPAQEGSAVDEDRFRYAEQDPPLTGKERHRDYNRQRSRFLYHNDMIYREQHKQRMTELRRTNPGFAERQRQKSNECNRLRYLNDPEFRERRKAYTRAYLAERRVAEMLP